MHKKQKKSNKDYNIVLIKTITTTTVVVWYGILEFNVPLDTV